METERRAKRRYARFSYCFIGERSYLVKVLTTPVGGSLSCMSVKDGKETMAGDTLVVVDEGVCILQWIQMTGR